MRAADRRQAVYQAIRLHVEARGFAPTVRELADALHCSPSCIAQHLDVMRAHGMVDWEDGKGRTLRLVPRAAE